RMHWLPDERFCAPVIQLALYPIVPLLLVEPRLGNSLPTKGAPAPLKQAGHRESVFALFDLYSQPRLNPDEETSRDRSTAAPGPAGLRPATGARRGHRNDYAAPSSAYPIENRPVVVCDNNLNAVIEASAPRSKVSDYCDAPFAIHQSGGVGPVRIRWLRQHQAERWSAGAASRPLRKTSSGSAADSKSTRSSSRSAPAWPRPAIASSAVRSACST